MIIATGRELHTLCGKNARLGVHNAWSGVDTAWAGVNNAWMVVDNCPSRLLCGLDGAGFEALAFAGGSPCFDAFGGELDDRAAVLKKQF